MVTANTDRTNYLSLALDARTTINALVHAAETGEQSPELTDAIEDTVESLKALDTGDLLYSRLRSQFPYQSFEQVKILEEVQTTMKESHVADKLSELAKHLDPEKKKEILALAITFFSALENRALQRYNNAANAASGK
jgi:hypothetical protein